MVLKDIGRIQAFLVHLAISLAIFIVLLLVIVLVWYPRPFFSSDGGWQGIQLVAGVDIILGPLLTLIVFKQGKPSLKFDLMVIALIQFSALSAGVWIVHQERPVAVVFADDRMIPIPAYQFQEAGMNISDLSRFGDSRPAAIMVELPEDVFEYARVLREAVQRNRPVYLDGTRYVPLDISRLDKLQRASVDMAEYIQGRPKEEQEIYSDFLKGNPEADGHYLFIPLHSRNETLIVVMSREDLGFVASLSIKPPTDYFAQGGKIKFKLPREVPSKSEPGHGDQVPETGPDPATSNRDQLKSGPAAD